jgi:hypothetical protein
VSTDTDATPMTDAEIARALADPDADPDEPAVDPEAPYGRFEDGRPRKRRKTTRPRGGTPPAPGTSKRRAKKPSHYEEVAGGLLQLAVMPLLIVSPLDGLAVADHAPAVARAVGVTAAERPELAALLDRLATVGPYAVLLAALAPLAIQIAVNHGLLGGGAASSLGAVPARVMRDRLRTVGEPGE